MAGSDSEELLSKGLRAFEKENFVSALCFLEQACQKEASPDAVSHLAVCIARERGLVKKALEMCTEAIEKEPGRSVHHLNKGRVLLFAKRREEAVDAFRRGLAVEANPDIGRELERLGIRKRPVIPFLPRHNLLNKYLGIILSKLRLR
jgi:tetratricopeptide (TPR) repeat protein